MVSRTHRVALDWLFDRINLDPKIQIKYIDTKNNSQTYWQTGRFTRDEWNHLCFCPTSAISVPPMDLKWCRKEHKKMQVKKESQQNQNRWWIWPRDTAQGSNVIASTASESPGKTKSERVKHPLTFVEWAAIKNRRLVMGASSSDNSQWNIDDKWSSQEWKSGDMLGARTGYPQMTSLVTWSGYGLSYRRRIERFSKITIILAQGQWSIAKDIGTSSRRCNAWHRQTFLNWWMFMSSTLEASVFIGKYYSELLHCIKKYRKESHFETDVWHSWKVS